MIDEGVITFDDYLTLLTSIIQSSQHMGHKVFLLNHEGRGDEDLMRRCAKNLKEGVEIVTGLNALEVKGLISISYMVVSSRFHGVVSALNASVPCLATSWSHKYKELFRDYEIDNALLPIQSVEESLCMVERYLDKNINYQIRTHLQEQGTKIQSETRRMWSVIFGDN